MSTLEERTMTSDDGMLSTTTCFLCRLVDGHTVNTKMGAVFQGLLSPLFTTTYRTSGCSVDAFTQLCGLLDLWATRGVYAKVVTDGITAQLFAVVCIISAARPTFAHPFSVVPCCTSILWHSITSASVLLVLLRTSHSRSLDLCISAVGQGEFVLLK
jgi:hypothetical protein